MIANLKFALRMLVKAPGFTAIAVIDACARYWCEHRDLQRIGRRIAPPAFVSKTE